MNEWLKKKHFRVHGDKTPIHPFQKIATAGIFILAILIIAQSLLTPSVIEKANRMLSAVLPGTIINLTNTERTTRNLSTLKHNPLLDEAARLKAEHMKKYDYFAHFSPDGISPWYWFDNVHYDYVYAGENLAIYFKESKDVVKAWMDSPLHKENILKEEYTEIGVAVVEGKHDGYDTVFIVQLFGTPTQNLGTKNTTAPSTLKPTLLTNRQQIPEQNTSTVQGKTITQKEVIPEEETGLLEEIPLVTINEDEEETTETKQTSQDKSKTTIERVEIEGNAVYLSDHISTSTITLGSINTKTANNNALGADTKTILAMLYTIIAILTVGFVVATIYLAEKRLQHAHALYGITLLVIVTLLTALQAHVVIATTLP